LQVVAQDVSQHTPSSAGQFPLSHSVPALQATPSFFLHTELEHVWLAMQSALSAASQAALVVARSAHAELMHVLRHSLLAEHAWALSRRHCPPLQVWLAAQSSVASQAPLVDARSAHASEMHVFRHSLLAAHVCALFSRHWPPLQV